MQFSTDTILSVFGMLPAALFIIAALGVFGASTIAPVNEMVARSKKKIFFDKFAEQLTAMNLLAAVVAIAGLGICFFSLNADSDWFNMWLKRQQVELMIFGGAFSLMLIGATTYKFTWKKLRKKKDAHIPMGLLTTLTGLASLGAAAYIAISMRTSYIIAAGATKAMVTALQSVYVPFLVFLLAAALSSAGAMSLIYLVLRRNKDDFGRDYYKFSLPLAARWSIYPTILVLIAQFWLVMTLPEAAKTIVMSGSGLILWGASMAITALCCGLWFPISKSETPLRFKGLVYLGTLLLWVAYAFFISTGFMILNAIK
ncbi:MAG: hypothetical protein ACNI27_09895 [Desulfovibrio sp.]